MNGPLPTEFYSTFAFELEAAEVENDLSPVYKMTKLKCSIEESFLSLYALLLLKLFKFIGVTFF